MEHRWVFVKEAEMAEGRGNGTQKRQRPFKERTRCNKGANFAFAKAKPGRKRLLSPVCPEALNQRWIRYMVLRGEKSTEDLSHSHESMFLNIPKP